MNSGIGLTLPALWGLPRWCSGKESTFQRKRRRFDPWVRKIHWRRKWQLTPVFPPGKSYGQRNLVGYSPWGHKRVRYNLVTKQLEWVVIPFYRGSFQTGDQTKDS